MDELETNYRNTAISFSSATTTYFTDSVKTVYRLTAERYLKAADQLKNAGNGFDLKQLVVYYGADDEKQNAGSSFNVEYKVREALESGRAVVYKNDQRIYTLNYQNEFDSANFLLYTVIIYYERLENVIFKYSYQSGW